MQGTMSDEEIKRIQMDNDLNDLAVQRANVMKRLDDWDMAAEKEGAYYIILPTAGSFIQSTHPADDANPKEQTLDRTIQNFWKTSGNALKFCGEDPDTKERTSMMYMVNMREKKFMKIPNLHDKVEAEKLSCHPDWPLAGAEHIFATKGMWFGIFGNTVVGTSCMNTNMNIWKNKVLPAFCEGALKYFAVANRYYAVYWDDDFGKLFYRVCYDPQTMKDVEVKAFHDNLMAYIPGFSFEEDRILNVEIGEAKLLGETPKVSNEFVFSNDSDGTIQQVFKYKTTTSKSCGVNWNSSISIKEDHKVAVEVPLTAKTEHTISLNYSFGAGGSMTQTDAVETEMDTTVTVPPHSKIVAKTLLTEAKAEVPFTVLYTSGRKRMGTWKGVSFSKVMVETYDMPN